MNPQRGANPGPSRGRGRGRGNFRPYYKKKRDWSNKPLPPDPLLNNTTTDSEGTPLLSRDFVAPADSKQIAKINLSDTPLQYPGWKLYFADEKFNQTNELAKNIKAFEKHFETHPNVYHLSKVAQNLWFPLNLIFLLNDDNFKAAWPSFHEDLVESPEKTLACAGVSMHRLVSVTAIEDSVNVSASEGQYKPLSVTVELIQPRIVGFSVISLRSIDCRNYDKLISIRGNITKVGPAEITCSWMAYRCSLCGNQQAIRQNGKELTPPLDCSVATCRARKNFVAMRSSIHTRLEAVQMVRLQDGNCGEKRGEFSQLPRSIDVELRQELADSLCPGDDVIITGVLKVRPQEEMRQKGQVGTLNMYLKALGVFDNKSLESADDLEFSERDLEAIKLISEEPCPFKLFVQSLCPKMCGQEMVKAGIVLALFGGAGSQSHNKSEVHVLLLGDPGVGKSQLLQTSSSVSPRGSLVIGNRSTGGAGLTIAVRQDKYGTTLEAGALILADQGVCCIDDIDKIASNQEPIIEMIEQRTVTVSKYGVMCTLPARSSIIAAANPTGGHYDRSKNIGENVRINPALLSLFDLVFILLDKPDHMQDNQLTEHIEALHSGSKKIPSNSAPFALPSKMNDTETIDLSGDLEEVLKLMPGEDMELLPIVLMKKYIAFAKKNIFPRLSAGAGDILKGFYDEFIEEKAESEFCAVTTRHLEGLIRLTQARARLELVAEATERHAQDVIDIVRYSQLDAVIVEQSDPQLNRSQTGSMSQASQLKKFLRMLEVRAGSLGKSVFDFDELKDMATRGGITCSVTQLIDAVNLQGFLIKKGRNVYEFVGE